MIVERIEVEEGFLDGLDLEFQEGLNVIIGPRGSGKTSVIELIRYCLGSKGVTKRSTEFATQQALAILGSGQVSVTMNDDLFGRFVVSRTAEDTEPRTPYPIQKPLIFSQNEIESIGVQAKNRLNLIDGFESKIAKTEGQEKQLLAQIRSTTIEMRDLTQELDILAEQIAELESAPKELKALQAEEASILKTVEAKQKEQKRLKDLGGILAALSVRASVFERTSAVTNKWLKKLTDLTDSPPLLEDWPASTRAKKDLTDKVKEHIDKSLEYIESAQIAAQEACNALENQVELNKSNTTKYDDEARTLRKQLDSLQSGAGDAARKVAKAKEKVGQLSAIKALTNGKRKQLKTLQDKRKELLLELDILKETRYQSRVTIAQSLNEELSPGIEVKVRRSALSADYANTLSGLLRGSGLRYTTLAPLLAERLSPRELAEAVELDDEKSISEYGEIQIARANKLISHLKNSGLEDLLTCTVEDGIDFRLLDGTDYKSSEQASMGQRCTIVLPILLRRYKQSLILDQPEDHLDNAFIVGTLIKAIKKRKENAQLILATHNANIPVLGEADLVVLMGSDGEHGYVSYAGSLGDDESVEAITSVMEGGLEAFNQRASFYSGEFEDL